MVSTATRCPAAAGVAKAQINETASAILADIDSIIETRQPPRKASLRAGEWLVVGALAAMELVALLNAEAVPLATRTSLATVGFLFAVAALALGEERGGWRFWFRELLPVPLIPYIFLNLGRLIPLVNSTIYDAQLEALDRLLLGSEVQAALYALVLPVWLTEVLTIAYSTFFLNAIVMVVDLAYRRDPYLSRVTSTVILTFLLSYAGYFVVPAYGPRATVAQERYATLAPGIVGQPLRDFLDHWEKTKTDAFPSGHTMVTLAVLYCLRRRQRTLYNRLLPVGALLIAATVLLTYHYVVDVLAAVPLTVASLLLARRLIGPIPVAGRDGPAPGRPTASPA
jgi:membrane-associated phospholipid phosphatase